MRVELRDAQVDIAKNLEAGDFVAIRNLRLRPSGGGTLLAGRLGGDQRLITKLNSKATGNTDLRALLRCVLSSRVLRYHESKLNTLRIAGKGIGRKHSQSQSERVNKLQHALPVRPQRKQLVTRRLPLVPEQHIYYARESPNGSALRRFKTSRRASRVRQCIVFVHGRSISVRTTCVNVPFCDARAAMKRTSPRLPPSV